MYPSFIFITEGASANKGNQSHLSYNSQMRSQPTKSNLTSGCDIPLTESGRKQAQKIKSLINKMDHIDTVIVSPLSRALQTCDIIFGDQKHIKIHVEPLLCERLTTLSSLGTNIKQSSHIYNQKGFDFTRIPEEIQQRWYIDTILSEDQKNKIFQISQKQNKTLTQSTIQLLKSGPIQTQKQLENRTKKLKKQLISYKQKTNKKIALVGHPKIFQSITATGSFQNGQPINGILLGTGQIKQIPIVIEGYQFHDHQMQAFCKLPFVSNS